MIKRVKMNEPLFLLLGFIYFLSAPSAKTWSEAHLIDGIFTEPTLQTGYHLIATIPVGASNLNVTELRRTNNYLAIRLHDGRYLFNGNYSINWSGTYKAAGTSFVYRRQTRRYLESLTAAGPLLEAVDVMLLYQEPNSGIVYRYHAPTIGASKKGKNNLRMMIADEGSPSVAVPGPPLVKRYRNKRKFAWIRGEMSGCSKTCGGGVETRNFLCVREHNQVQVPTKRCHGLEKPAAEQIRCNIIPCPPKWRMGSWSDCSVTCGVGVRTRRDSECVQEINNLLTVRVADGACMSEAKSPVDTETCVMTSCDDDDDDDDDDETTRSTWKATNNVTPVWNVGEWSPCSVSCGRGKRTRSVICITSNRFCSVSEKPASHETCDADHDCEENERYDFMAEERRPKFRWLHTEWSQQCSTECGTGYESRRVVCVGDDLDDNDAMKNNDRWIEQRPDDKCDEKIRPETTRSCSSNRTCGGRWFTGPWSQCSASCDAGEQTREAVCVAVNRGTFAILPDTNCPAIKPETRKPCREKSCRSVWYTSPWNQCSRTCGTGVQTREVKCLNPNEEDEIRHQCDEAERPDSRRACNDHSCRSSVELRDGWTRSQHIEKTAQTRNGLTGREDCKDNLSNCVLVTQARLCIYPFYRTNCCASCVKSGREETE